MLSRWSLAGALSAALCLAACGDDASDDAAPVPPAPVGEATATPPAAPQGATPTIAPAPTPPAVEPAAAAGGAVETPAVPVAPGAAADAPPPAAAPGIATAPEVAPAAAVAPDDLLARIRAADPAAGEGLAAQCGICHTFEAGAGTRVAPTLYDVVGAPIARDVTFTYSPALIGLAATGGTWTFERLDAFLANPAEAVPGTRMAFVGMADPTDRAALLAYLTTLSDDPEPLGGARDDGRAAALAAGLAQIAFTEEQVAAGRDYTTRICARCHGPTLGGMMDTREFGEAPAIVGPRFEARWFGHPVSDLFALLADDTRPDFHGGLTGERYATIIAYLAERSGLVAGAVPLPEDKATLATIGFYQ